MFPNLPPDFAIDTETTGLLWHRHRMFGFAVAWFEGSAVKSAYFDVRRTPKAKLWIKEQMRRARRVFAHNSKFDIHFLREAGCQPPVDKFHCTMVRESLINEHHMAYSLDYLSNKRLKKRKVEMSQEDKERMADLPFETVQTYACPDAELCIELAMLQDVDIRDQQLDQIYALERRLTPHLLEQERRGIRVDPDLAERRIKELDGIIPRLRKELDDTAGFPINPNPSGSIHELFKPVKGDDGIWRAIDGTPLEATKAGKASLGAEALKEIDHPAAMMILKVRKLIKLRDTFLKGNVLGHMDTRNNTVYPHINQVKGEEGGTGTGRLSYSGPALQQIPNRDKEMAALIRPVFLPDVDQDWGYGDLDQHEFRHFAHYTNNPTIIGIYADNPDADFHQLVTDITGIPRNAPPNGGAYAKQLNLGLVFSMGAGLLAKKMKLPYTAELVKFGNRDPRVVFRAGEETLKVLETYHAAIPGIKAMIANAKSIAEKRGYVRTFFGRHIRFPDRDFAYKAAGLIYQGSAADFNKYGIINICELLEGTNSRLLLNIHDEYNISFDPGEKIRLAKECKRIVEHRPVFKATHEDGSVVHYPTELRVPIRIDFQVGENWWEATKAPKIT